MQQRTVFHSMSGLFAQSLRTQPGEGHSVLGKRFNAKFGASRGATRLGLIVFPVSPSKGEVDYGVVNQRKFEVSKERWKNGWSYSPVGACIRCRSASQNAKKGRS
jgi:hypothetical protein